MQSGGVSNNNNNTETPSSFSNLPTEMREKVLSHLSRLSRQSLGLFAQASLSCESDSAFLRLLHAAIDAAPAFMEAETGATTALAAIVILKRHPHLLFRKGKIKNHHGQEIYASPYQIFLGAGDVWAIKQIHEQILDQIKDPAAKAAAYATAQAQFKEQFPNYDKELKKDEDEEVRLYDDRNKNQVAEIAAQLAIVKQCIASDRFTNDKPNAATEQAVKTLCQLFQPTPEEVIQSGLHFPLAIMKMVYETHDALERHRSFFTFAVIKQALNALSTVDGQCCQGGLKDLNIEEGPNRRCHSSYQHPLGKPLSLRFVNDKDNRGIAAIVDPYGGEAFYVSTVYSGYFDCFKKNGAPIIVTRGLSPGVASRRWDQLWNSYVEQKQQLFRDITHHIREKPTHCPDDTKQVRCVIV